MAVKQTDTKADIYKAYQELLKKTKAQETENKKLQDKVSEVDSLKEQFDALQESIATKSDEVQPKSTSSNSVMLMNLSLGQCHLIDGLLNVRFDRPFDKKPISKSKFEDFFYRFNEWFTNLDVMILDDDLAMQYGMKPYYDEIGLDVDKFEEAIEYDADGIVSFLDSYRNYPKVQMAFIKEYARQMHLKNSATDSWAKTSAIQEFARTKWGLEISLVEISKQPFL